KEYTDEYHKIAFKVFAQIGLPEFQEKVIKSSRSQRNEKYNLMYNTLSNKNLTKKQMKVMTDMQFYTWEKIYYSEMKYKNFKYKVVAHIIDIVSLEDLKDYHKILYNLEQGINLSKKDIELAQKNGLVFLAPLIYKASELITLQIINSSGMQAAELAIKKLKDET